MIIGAAILVGATFATVAGGQKIGQFLALAGHSERTAPIEAVVGNNVLFVPENMIRRAEQRSSGEYSRLDLYMRWPELTGYSRNAADIFNGRTVPRSLIFVTVEPSTTAPDMSARYAGVYRPLLKSPGIAGPAGLQLSAFRRDTGFEKELLAHGIFADGSLYVARCLAGTDGRQALAGCERDVNIGAGLSITYRFPRELLGDWRTMEPALRDRVNALIR
ncbi:hypothetical protein [Notoacmeibacter ruber]|uniref:hypothetical protein n=1 Tax=Notoacmeibacter ruber TaxID=2670375 RepID=UPI0011C4863E|nr:hypothetical protein [Notoacmeibacter ruber]